MTRETTTLSHPDKRRHATKSVQKNHAAAIGPTAGVERTFVS